MTKKERERLRDAIDCLEENPMNYEGAMKLLYPLAGSTWTDFDKGTKSIPIKDIKPTP